MFTFSNWANTKINNYPNLKQKETEAAICKFESEWKELIELNHQPYGLLLVSASLFLQGLRASLMAWASGEFSNARFSASSTVTLSSASFLVIKLIHMEKQTKRSQSMKLQIQLKVSINQKCLTFLFKIFQNQWN